MEAQIPMLITLTVLAGVFGGLVSYFGFPDGHPASHPPAPDASGTSAPHPAPAPDSVPPVPTDTSMWQPVVRGVGAAFLVPLFLKIADSKLVDTTDSAGLSGWQFFIYGGFCLAAAISSRAFIGSVSRQVIAMAAEAKQKSETAIQKSAAAQQRSDKAMEISQSASTTSEEAQKAGEIVRADVEQAKEDQSRLAAVVWRTARTGALPGAGKQFKAAPPGIRGAHPESDRDLMSSDPAKGMFGGLAQHDGWSISASVSAAGWSKAFFNVTLTITASSTAEVTSNSVAIHLHPTFKPDVVNLALGADRTLTYSFNSLGAFTVGVEANNGAILLELDLADPVQVPNAPQEFRER
ncbi:MAG TPA: YEATS-associated helix-containing protein [Candidatus Kapabacteria bacterium]|nr:YEATS-associated helix-containing protein [Candidatus Kapabacteria bacterium]